MVGGEEWEQVKSVWGDPVAAEFLVHVPAGHHNGAITMQQLILTALLGVKAKHGQRVQAAATARVIQGQTRLAKCAQARHFPGGAKSLCPTEACAVIVVSEQSCWEKIEDGSFMLRILQTLGITDVGRPPLCFR
jgi:hypothetical protein